jgi:hypothetical protein
LGHFQRECGVLKKLSDLPKSPELPKIDNYR